MSTLTIEVHCLLPPDDARWDRMESMTLEIGYPGLNGQTHWKHIGWVQEPHPGLTKSFSHALWSQNAANRTIVFDFPQVFNPGSGAPEKSYCYRAHLMGTDGKMQTTKMKIVEGIHANLFFSFKPHYPGANT